ncbi:TPA: ead/Ea22-like family protein [Escherichia coli]|nr:ead/Ea22-like family protein [Escherichia coli]MBZ8930172.1 ead/Ea22-like family protein [Escherichia coli]HCP2423712.1 ead/Ea22-like family protein [Escherichia coli]
MSNIDKQALRGQSVDANFYLAECCNCGQVMPSSKLIESRNYLDGDADCYCPNCNADDCDIDDMGSSASEAWNHQQKRIEALLDELERNQQYIKRRDQENEDIALTVGKLRVELETAKSKLNEQREYYEGVISDGSKRIAKLESNEVREDGNQFLVVRHPGKTPVIKHCTGDLEEFLRQLIEQDPLVTIDIITHRYYGVGGQWVQDAGEYLHMMSDAGIRIKGE